MMNRQFGRWRGLLAAVVLAGLSGMAGCSKNLATGQTQLNFISTDHEVKLGSEAAPQFLNQYGGAIPNKQIQDYVADIGNRMAAVSERPKLPWEFHTVDSKVLNAFALPGGKVFISRGLLMKLDNEAQLAGVLGHEIGHVTAQHIGQQMSQAMVVQGLVIGLGIAGDQMDEDWLKVLGVGAGAGGTLYLLKFGRDQESQSDWLALRYMTRVGYNPWGQKQVLEVLKRAAGEGARPPEWLSTHPLPDTRIDRITKTLREKYPDASPDTADGFYADRYRDVVLNTLSRMPPPGNGAAK